jgi:hypothetical protein
MAGGHAVVHHQAFRGAKQAAGAMVGAAAIGATRWNSSRQAVAVDLATSVAIAKATQQEERTIRSLQEEIEELAALSQDRGSNALGALRAIRSDDIKTHLFRARDHGQEWNRLQAHRKALVVAIELLSDDQAAETSDIDDAPKDAGGARNPEHEVIGAENPADHQIRVPSVVGLGMQVARHKIASVGLQLEWRDVMRPVGSERVPWMESNWKVTGQCPPAETVVTSGEKVVIAIAKLTDVGVPDSEASSRQAAEKRGN